MKILVCIWHPAHVHVFKNFIWEMEKRGHSVGIVVYEKEMNIYLLGYYGFNYHDLGSHPGGSLSGKMRNLVTIDRKLYTIIKGFDPDIVLGIGGAYISPIAKLLGKNYYSFNDTEHNFVSHLLTNPFATRIFTPSCFKKDFGSKQITYEGYHELAYLHPDHFTPDPSILDILGVEKDEEYVIMRFVSWEATHDFGHSGFSLDMKIRATEEISKYAKVFITSEGALPRHLEKNRIKIPPERIHDALYYATLSIGDGGTVASESAILGTPAILADTSAHLIGALVEQKNYGLLHYYSDARKSLKKALEILKGHSETEWIEKRNRLISEKINVAEYMVEQIERSIENQ